MHPTAPTDKRRSPGIWTVVWASLLIGLSAATNCPGIDSSSSSPSVQPPAPTQAQTDTADEGLQTIRRLLAQDLYKDALKLADNWIEAHPSHPQTLDALLLRASVKVAMRHYFDALYDYEAVIREYPSSTRYLEAIERELSIAEIFAAGLKRRFMGMRILSAAGDAEEIFIRTQERAPGSDLGERASWALANFYFDRAQMTSAVEAYDLFLLNYPQSIHREVALMRLIEANIATFRGPKFDPTGLIEAAYRIKTFQQNHPAAAQRMDAQSLLVRIDELLALKHNHIAQWYETRGQKRSAIIMYQQAVRTYPQTAAGQAAVRRLQALGADVVVPSQQTQEQTTPSPVDLNRDAFTSEE